jgi:hypothetical protein
MVVKAISRQAPKERKPIRDKSIVSRPRKHQKAAARQITREAEDKKAEQSNLHNLCFVNEMNISELATNFFGGVFTFCRCGRIEGETISQLHGQQQNTSDQSKLNESKPKASKQVLKKLFSRRSRRHKQVPNQSHWGQAAHNLHVMGSSGTSVRLEDSLLSKALSTKSSDRINEPMEHGLPVPGSAQEDPKESTETDMAAKQRMSGEQLLKKQLCLRPNTSRRPKKAPDQSHCGQASRNLHAMGSSGTSVRLEDSLLSKTLSTNSCNRINERMEQRLPVPGSAQDDPKESTETDMAAIKQMYETWRFKKDSRAERSSHSHNNQAKKGKESTNAINKESILLSQSRLSRLIGARPSKKSQE